MERGNDQLAEDESTGLLITPLEELNEFKTDREYLKTLTTTKADIFSADLRGYRDIYVNIWAATEDMKEDWSSVKLTALWNRDSLYPQNIWRKWYVMFWKNGAIWKTLISGRWK